MLLRTVALSSAFLTYGLPAGAYDFEGSPKPQAKKITTFDVAERRIDMMAVTPRARAAALPNYTDAETLNGGVYQWQHQMPGHPKPAVVSVDFRLQF